jgi:hypothetical protein
LTAEHAGFSLVVSRESETETIAVAGDLDIETGVRLSEAVRHAETGTADRIVIDLREADVVDHPAAEILWSIRVRMEEWPNRLRVIPPERRTGSATPRPAGLPARPPASG